MKEYHQYLDNQCQENINEDIEMSPNSERNPIRNGISPPENIRLNVNLTVQNPEVQNISLNNQSEEKKKDTPQGNTDINQDTQMNKDQESNDLENILDDKVALGIDSVYESPHILHVYVFMPSSFNVASFVVVIISYL